jgi:hypothetical protein
VEEVSTTTVSFWPFLAALARVTLKDDNGDLLRVLTKGEDKKKHPTFHIPHNAQQRRTDRPPPPSWDHHHPGGRRLKEPPPLADHSESSSSRDSQRAIFSEPNLLSRHQKKKAVTMEYTGKMLDGQMHGQGKLVYENGECYNGDWVKGACFECAGQHRGWSLGVLLSLMVGVVLRVGNANPDNLQENVTAAASTCTSMAASLTVRFRCCGRHAACRALWKGTCPSHC